MMHFNNDEEMKRLLRSVCRPTAPSPQFKLHLLDRLMYASASRAQGLTRHLWAQPRLLLPVAVSVILAVMSYGIWLQQKIMNMYLP